MELNSPLYDFTTILVLLLSFSILLSFILPLIIKKIYFGFMLRSTSLDLP